MSHSSLLRTQLADPRVGFGAVEPLVVAAGTRTVVHTLSAVAGRMSAIRIRRSAVAVGPVRASLIGTEPEAATILVTTGLAAPLALCLRRLLVDGDLPRVVPGALLILGDLHPRKPSLGAIARASQLLDVELGFLRSPFCLVGLARHLERGLLELRGANLDASGQSCYVPISLDPVDQWRKMGHEKRLPVVAEPRHEALMEIGPVCIGQAGWSGHLVSPFPQAPMGAFSLCRHGQCVASQPWRQDWFGV